jgi:ketosteroid isomerase-like protein
MSRKNVDLVLTGYEAWDRGDIETAFAPIDEDFEFHEDPQYPETGVYRGRKAFRGYFERFREEWDDYHVNAEEVRDSGDKVLVFTHQTARGKASGVQIDLRIAHLWTIRDGKAVRMQAYFDREEALKALEE